jgi:hypothetical protein
MFNFNGPVLQGHISRAMDFDSQGHVWIGTTEGKLIRYNGEALVFDSTNSPLPGGDSIWAICVDHADCIWLGTSNGLFKYDGHTFTHYHTGNSDLAYNTIWSIAVDKDNVLWLASSAFQEGGLTRYDGERFRLYNPGNSILPDPFVVDVIVDDKNVVWAAVSNKGVVKIDGENWTYYDGEAMGVSIYQMGNLAFGPECNLVFNIDYAASSAIHHDSPHIVKYNGTQWEVESMDYPGNGGGGFASQVEVDQEGNIWALSWNPARPVMAFNGEAWVWPENQIAFQHPFSIAVSPENQVWISTESGFFWID